MESSGTTLLQWIEQEGAEGRRRLFEAVKPEYPKFTKVGLTNYIRGHRIPEFQGPGGLVVDFLVTTHRSLSKFSDAAPP